MPTHFEALESEVLRLSAAERTRLLDRVVESLDTDAFRDAAWDALAARRQIDFEQGTADAADLDSVLSRLRSELQ